MSEKKDRFLVPSHFLHFPFIEEDFWGLAAAHEKGLSISEDNNHVYVEAHLPGLKPENIDVTFEKGVLWIRGERHEEEEDKKKKFYKKASSSFSYRVHVPGLIDEKKDPEAVYKDGVMKVSFIKSKENQTKKINIKTK